MFQHNYICVPYLTPSLFIGSTSKLSALRHFLLPTQNSPPAPDLKTQRLAAKTAILRLEICIRIPFHWTSDSKFSPRRSFPDTASSCKNNHPSSRNLACCWIYIPIQLVPYNLLSVCPPSYGLTVQQDHCQDFLWILSRSQFVVFQQLQRGS